jgi:hypothetical protein
VLDAQLGTDQQLSFTIKPPKRVGITLGQLDELRLRLGGWRGLREW